MPPTTPGHEPPARSNDSCQAPAAAAPPARTAPPVPAQRTPQEQDGWQVLLPHQRRLLALAISCGATPDTARDVVQDALLKAAGRSGLDPERVAGYLIVIVRRLMSSRHRREQLEQERAEDRRLELPFQPGHEDTICQQAEAAWLQQQLSRLPDRQRQALLPRGAGRSTLEIATELDVSRKAVEGCIHRGRDTLRRLLDSA